MASLFLCESPSLECTPQMYLPVQDNVPLFVVSC